MVGFNRVWISTPGVPPVTGKRRFAMPRQTDSMGPLTSEPSPKESPRRRRPFRLPYATAHLYSSTDIFILSLRRSRALASSEVPAGTWTGVRTTPESLRSRLILICRPYPSPTPSSGTVQYSGPVISETHVISFHSTELFKFSWTDVSVTRLNSKDRVANGALEIGCIRKRKFYQSGLTNGRL
ncbi:unnamed protein product [Tuber aestivum]|uniref:Uncharacterized protein n=1 Tax=Tuber aestivum TaxID=59557 RepID=A0A292Q131_9PEZI|nr:unnamed protein product [Tuber aestivum]